MRPFITVLALTLVLIVQSCSTPNNRSAHSGLQANATGTTAAELEAKQHITRAQTVRLTDSALNAEYATLEEQVYQQSILYLLQAAASHQTPPPRVTRQLMMLTSAYYDILHDQPEDPWILSDYVPAQPVTDLAVSMSAATREMLYEFYPDFENLWSINHEKIIELSTDQSPHVSEAYGEKIALDIISSRDKDSIHMSQTPASTQAPAEKWRPTAPYFEDPLLLHWPDITPMSTDDISIFRLAPPNSMNSDAFKADMQEVQSIGGADSTKRTAEQTEIALYWADGKGTVSPPGTWNLIALDLIKRHNLPPKAAVTLLAKLNITLFDTSLAVWDTKYHYDYWRPVDAIHYFTDDDEWISLIEAPNFPEYASGHSAFSSAAATVLEATFDDTSFTHTPIHLPEITRSFSSASDAANEAALSRVYGGIHYRQGSTEGLAQGRSVAAHVLEYYSSL